MDVFSYHTFILPFIWNVEGSTNDSLKRFCDCFEENPNWVSTDFTEEHVLNDCAEIISEEDAYLLYAEYQYFTTAARRAIYGFGSDIVKNYVFKPDLVRNKARYIIQKKINGKDYTYTLMVNAIRLKIYNTGVALFVLECENLKGGIYAAQNNMAAVKNINDYGRRMCLPFLPKEAGGYYSLCADKLTLSIDGVGDFVEDYRGFASGIKTASDIFEKVSLTHMSDFVKRILGFGSDYGFSSNPKHAKNNDKVFYIYPAVDDRMFVACVVHDKECSARYTAKKPFGDYMYRDVEGHAKDLYELVFVDPDKECSCMDSEMRLELLEKHLYKRWIDYGTITAVANQSLISVTNFGPTVNSFITQYYQLCCLCLAQRASILNFQREATTLSQNIEKQGHSIKTSTVSKILDLQERFVAFQNQLSFTEVTSQEQGIDLYKMIMESFYIEEERTALGAQLESLYAAANTNLDFSLNKHGAIIAIAAIVLSLASFCTDLVATISYFAGYEQGVEPPIKLFIPCLLGVAAVISVITLAILFKFRRKK